MSFDNDGTCFALTFGREALSATDINEARREKAMTKVLTQDANRLSEEIRELDSRIDKTGRSLPRSGPRPLRTRSAHAFLKQLQGFKSEQLRTLASERRDLHS